MMTSFPLEWILKGAYEKYKKGVHAMTVQQRTIPSRLLEPKVKNRSRLHYKMADLQASRYGPDVMALLMDEDGFIAEGSGSNFFIVKDRCLITPEPRNILRGISRQHVIDIAKKLSIPVYEKNIEPYDVYEAEEVFFTSTPYSILPITTFNDRVVGNGLPGRITRFLTHTWGEGVGVDIIGQVKRWDNA